MIVIIITMSVAAIVGMWLSIAAIAEAAAEEKFRLISEPRIFKSGVSAGWKMGWRFANDAAKCEASEFKAAQRENWIGPMVDRPYWKVRVPERNLAHLRFETFITGSVPDFACLEVMFRCVIYAHQVNGVIFKHARWELADVEPFKFDYNRKEVRK